MARKLLYIGLAPRVIALDPDSGEVVWATEIPHSGIVATIRLAGRRLFAGSAGEVSCLDADTGAILWHNPLKGFGMHPVLFAGDDAAVAATTAVTAGATVAGTPG